MFEVYYGIDNSIAILTFIFWWMVASRTTNLAFQANGYKMCRNMRGNLRLTYIGIALAIGRLVWQLPLGLLFGWPFVQEKLLLAIPLIMIPISFVMLYSIPRLKRIVKELSSDVTLVNLRGAASPALVVPMQTTFYGAAAGLYVLLFPQAPPYVSIGIWLSVLVAAAVPILWLWQHRREGKLGVKETYVFQLLARREGQGKLQRLLSLLSA
ncbi:MAG: hypothetical protein WDZ91_15750 [Paenibacillaceae bacterium]